MDVIGEHLHNVHNLSPFECLKCNTVFKKLNLASEHCTEYSLNTNACTSLDIRVNFGPIYNNSKKDNFSSLPSFLFAPSSINDVNQDNNDILKISAKEIGVSENSCQDCPFKCLSSEKFKVHQLGHNGLKSKVFFTPFKIVIFCR